MCALRFPYAPDGFTVPAWIGGANLYWGGGEMSKRRKAARAAKAKRQQAAHQANWMRFWPYAVFGGVAVALVAALFLVSTGGDPSTSEVQASYPVGYTPPTDGDESAPVEFVMWADYQCPFCGRFEA